MTRLFNDLPEKARVEMTRRMAKFDPMKRDREIERLRRAIKESVVETILGCLAFLALVGAIAVMALAAF